MSLIELNNISKTYNQNTANSFFALTNINLEIEAGDFISIMGPSGSGKSTLLNIIGLLDIADQGNYRLHNLEITSLHKAQLPAIRRREIGFIFQIFNLLSRLTVFQNIQMPLFYSNFPYREQKEKVEELLELVKLTNRRNYLPTKLSGGEKQRVAIARALVNDPSVILADEPTGNLDSRSGREIMEALTELNQKGRTIIVVTHDPNISAFARRHLSIVDGLLTDMGAKQ